MYVRIYNYTYACVFIYGSVLNILVTSYYIIKYNKSRIISTCLAANGTKIEAKSQSWLAPPIILKGCDGDWTQRPACEHRDSATNLNSKSPLSSRKHGLLWPTDQRKKWCTQTSTFQNILQSFQIFSSASQSCGVTANSNSYPFSWAEYWTIPALQFSHDG